MIHLVLEKIISFYSKNRSFVHKTLKNIRMFNSFTNKKWCKIENHLLAYLSIKTYMTAHSWSETLILLITVQLICKNVQ